MKAGFDLANIVKVSELLLKLVIGTALAFKAIIITANKVIKAAPYFSEKPFLYANKSFISSIPILFTLQTPPSDDLSANKINDKFSEYPYNLIPDLDMYINIEIWFIVILINVLITAYIIEKFKGMPKLDWIKNERMKKILNFMYKRYISTWSVSKNIIIIWCILMLLVCIAMSKFILFTVINS